MIAQTILDRQSKRLELKDCLKIVKALQIALLAFMTFPCFLRNITYLLMSVKGDVDVNVKGGAKPGVGELPRRSANKKHVTMRPNASLRDNPQRHE
jgi:hypothetical protein